MQFLWLMWNLLWYQALSLSSKPKSNTIIKMKKIRKQGMISSSSQTSIIRSVFLCWPYGSHSSVHRCLHYSCSNLDKDPRPMHSMSQCPVVWMLCHLRGPGVPWPRDFRSKRKLLKFTKHFFLLKCLSRQNTILYYIYYPSVFLGRLLYISDRWQVTPNLCHFFFSFFFHFLFHTHW